MKKYTIPLLITILFLTSCGKQEEEKDEFVDSPIERKGQIALEKEYHLVVVEKHSINV